MMCDWAMTAPYHIFPIETVKLGTGSWERRGVQMQGATK